MDEQRGYKETNPILKLWGGCTLDNMDNLGPTQGRKEEEQRQK